MSTTQVQAKQKPSFAEKYAELWKFIKFSVLGLASTIVELLVHYFFQWVVFSNYSSEPFAFLGLVFKEGKGYFYSYLISTAIGYTVAFILHRKVTFHADANPYRSIILYILMVVFTVFATSFLGTLVTNWFVARGLQKIGETAGKPIMATVAVLWTYPLNRFVIHRKKKEEVPAE